MMRMAHMLSHAGELADTGQTSWGMMGWPMMGTANGGTFWFWWLQWLVVWALIVALLVAAVRYLWKKGDKK